MQKKATDIKPTGNYDLFKADYQNNLLKAASDQGIPLVFPKEHEQKLADNIETIIRSCGGIPLCYGPGSLFEKKKDYKP
jgi:hypothetical protein